MGDLAEKTATELLNQERAMALVVVVRETTTGQLEVNVASDVRMGLDPMLDLQLRLLAEWIGTDVERRVAQIGAVA